MEHKSCINCGKKYEVKNSMQDNLRAKAKGIASFLCVACLWAQIGVAELDFGKAAAQDYAANDFSTQSIDFAFTTTTGSTLLVSPGDLMIDFAHIYQIEHPTPPIRLYRHGESI